MINEKLKYINQIIILFILLCNVMFIPLFHSGAYNAQASSTWTQETYNDFNNGESNKITIVDNDGDGELKLDITLENKWIEKSPVNKPSSRIGFDLASIYGTNDFILFGGNDGTDRLNDTWIYNLTENKWIKKEFVIKPQIREHHALVSIYGTDNALLFGGSPSYEDTWVYDLSDDSWTFKDPLERPSDRWGHGMAPIYDTEKVLLFGGNHFGQIGETWIYNLIENEWILKNPPGIKPSDRYYHKMSSI